MAGDEKREPESNFTRFIRETSEAVDRVEAFDEDPERAMSEAGLSEDEKELVRRGDEEEILSALGQQVGFVHLIIGPLRVRFRRKPPPTKPT